MIFNRKTCTILNHDAGVSSNVLPEILYWRHFFFIKTSHRGSLVCLISTSVVVFERAKSSKKNIELLITLVKQG